MRFSSGCSAIFLLILPFDLGAQTQSQATVPTVQPTFTRVFAAEETRLQFPSLSPDGRWIAFSTSSEADGEEGLWLIPAEGGEAIRLTEGNSDGQPVWFPSGDKLAFRSSRPARGGEGGIYVMTLSLDPETGRPTGPPRQVSIERISAFLDVSPDGEWISFVDWTEGKQAVLVVPAVGGASRRLIEANPAVPVWAPDGESLYYTVDQPVSGQALVRVFLQGSQVDTVFTWPRAIRVFGYREGMPFLLREIPQEEKNEDSEWEVATLEGVPLGRFELPGGMDPSYSLTSTGGLLVVKDDMLTTVEVLPIDGGPPRELNLNGGRNPVLGWSPDGQQLLVRTALDGEEMYFLAATDGSSMRQVPLPGEALDAFEPVLSKDGSHLLFAVNDGEDEPVSLKVLDIENGGTREISRPSFPVVTESFEVSGRGTTWGRDDDDFLFVEQNGDAYELRGFPPTGPSRLLRTFRRGLPASIGVYENRIAYVWGPDGSTNFLDRQSSVELAIVGDTEAQMVLTFRGLIESVTWSRDGRCLALKAYRMPENQESPGFPSPELIVLEFDSAGNVIGEPAVLTPPDMYWWSPHWLPNGRGLLVVGNDGNIWRVSLDAGVRPVPVTGDLSDSVWWFKISPDGRSIAYTKNILQGSSIWRVDLGEALVGKGGR